MPYNYQEQRQYIFTEHGQVMFINIRDHVKALLSQSGAVRMEEAMDAKTNAAGSSWDMLACVDRLVELGELREIPQSSCPAQHRVFVAGR